MKEFEELLDGVLGEMANPEPPPGMEARVLARVAVPARSTLGRRLIWGAVAAGIVAVVIVGRPGVKVEREDAAAALSHSVSNERVSREPFEIQGRDAPVMRRGKMKRKHIVNVSRLPKDAPLQIAPIEMDDLQVESIEVASLMPTHTFRKVATR